MTIPQISHTIVIGAGGTGGCLIPQLARLLLFHQSAQPNIAVWDGDDFQIHNLTRQLTTEATVGRNKANTVAEFCAALGLPIKARPHFISAEALQRAITPASFPLVIATVDNNATRLMSLRTLEEAAADYFWVSPGNADDSDGTQPIRGQVMWSGFIRGTQYGLRVEDLVATYPELVDNDPMPRDGGCAHLAPSSPQLLTANALAAAAALTVVQNLLDNTLVPHNHIAAFTGRGVLQAATA